jgi:hypothetical protein
MRLYDYADQNPHPFAFYPPRYNIPQICPNFYTRISTSVTLAPKKPMFSIDFARVYWR